MLTYFSWWYGEGLVKFWQGIEVVTARIFAFFSVKDLTMTLFNPWKRDSFSIENASLDVRLRLWLDNMISRLIGAIMRSFIIILGLAVTILFFGLALIIFVVWLGLPIVVFFLIINGVRVIVNG